MGYKILQENTNINKKDPKDRVYCQEGYAQDLYDLYVGGSTPKMSKDIAVGELHQVTIGKISITGKIYAETESFQTVFLDLNKESKFMQSLGIDHLEPGMKLDVMIEDTRNDHNSASIEKGYLSLLKKDLFNALKDGKSAYKVKIKSVNNGGFMVDFNGLNCFMPGSLAAANKILDFDSMIGKEVYVMVENYLEQSDMFVMSVKKYIQSILPSKIKELSLVDKYTGTITGVLPFGTFVEWDDVFTGLIHESESTQDFKGLRPGDEVDFWIKEVKEIRDIRKDDEISYKIILTQKGPSEEGLLMTEFKNKYEGEEVSGIVKEIKNFGIFVELSSGIIGMLQPRELKKNNVRINIGDEVLVYVKQVDPILKKVYLKAITD
jgi:ribosomal protein S1